METIDEMKEELRKLTEPKDRKLTVPTFDEYIQKPECKYNLTLMNLVRLLIDKNIITDAELISTMKKDFNDNILPDLKIQVETYNKYVKD